MAQDMADHAEQGDRQRRDRGFRRRAVAQTRANAQQAGGGAGDGSDDDAGLDVKKILNVVWRGKWVVLVAVLLCSAAAFVWVKQQTPIYSATALVLIEGQRQNVVDLPAVMSGVDVSSSGLLSEAEVIRSDQLADRVIAKLRLDRDAEFNRLILPAEPGLTRRAVGAVSVELERLIYGSVFAEIAVAEEERAADESGAERPLSDAELAPIRAAFKSRLTVQPQPRTQVMQVSFKSMSPRKAALIANTIAEQYIVNQLEAKFDGTQRATLWLNERLQSLRERVVEAERAVETFRGTLAEQSGVSVELTQQQLAQLNASLVEARARRAEAETRYDSVRSLAAQGRDISSAAAVQSVGQNSALQARLSELRRREAELGTRYGPKHPTMINVRAEIRDTLGAIQNEGRRILEVLRNEAEVARAREESLQQSVNGLQGTSLAQGQASVRLRELEREAEATRTLYENFLTRFKETSESETLQQAEARVIAKAEAPFTPSEPNARVSVAIGSVLGAMSGLGFIFLLERLNNTFRSRADLEAMSGLPVIASTPVVPSAKRRTDVFKYFQERPNSALAEAVRNLRTSLLLSDVDNPPRVILVTSSVPAEGKSSLSWMLASTSARMGKPTIIVDCDMRRPTLNIIIEKGDGDLVGVLSGEASLTESIVRFDGGDPLFALPTTVATGNPADLLSSQRFRMLIDKLTQHYEMVVIDSPPVSVVTDARILATIADVTVLSVRWDDTPTELVLDSIDQLETVGANLVGTVLSMVDERQLARYSYGYRGRYGRYYDPGSSYYAN